MDGDSLARVRADFETLKAKLRDSVSQLDPERYDRITAKLVALDREAIRERIAQRRGSHHIQKAMAELERRLSLAEELDRERA